jgi:hypothetical protein
MACALGIVSLGLGGCHPSIRQCDEYGWGCTADCSGGECVLPDGCHEVATKLGPLFQTNAACTLVVRVAFADRAPSGYAVICRPMVVVTEANARQAAARDTGIDIDLAKLRSEPGQRFMGPEADSTGRALSRDGTGSGRA